VEALKAAGLVSHKTNIRVCGAFGDCQHSNSYLSCHSKFFEKLIPNENKGTNQHNLTFLVELDFTILDKLPFEAIVGRKDIITHRLWERVVTGVRTPKP